MFFGCGILYDAAPLCAGKDIGSVLIQALAHGSGLRCQPGMNFRRYAERKLAGIRLVWDFTCLTAMRKVIVNSLLKSFPQFLNAVSFIRNDVINASQPAKHNIVILAIFNSANISIIGHCIFHGFIPMLTRKSRVASTWYALAVLG